MIQEYTEIRSILFSCARKLRRQSLGSSVNELTAVLQLDQLE